MPGSRAVALQGIGFGALGVALHGFFLSPPVIIHPSGGAGRLQGLYFNLPRPTSPTQVSRQRRKRDEILWLKP